MSDLDIKLLQVFAEIYATGSVSLAANRLGLSQPTVSFSLGKLRERYDDPLFVRTGSVMQPTEFAKDLHVHVIDLLATFRAVASHRKSFEAAHADQIFRIAMTDISQIVLLPRLLNRLQSIAPSIRIAVLHISEDTAQQLETGAADLAVGFMPQLDAGFYQQKLFAQDYVGLAARHHPRLGECPDVEQYKQEGHLRVSARGTGHASLDQVMGGAQMTRRVMLELPDYLGLANIVGDTDLVATVPRLLAEIIKDSETLRLFELPFAVPSYQVKQHWHERSHADPAHQWLRGVLTDLFLVSENLCELAGH